MCSSHGIVSVLSRVLHSQALYLTQQAHVVEHDKMGEPAWCKFICMLTPENIFTIWCLSVFGIMSIWLFLLQQPFQCSCFMQFGDFFSLQLLHIAPLIHRGCLQTLFSCSIQLMAFQHHGQLLSQTCSNNLCSNHTSGLKSELEVGC